MGLKQRLNADLSSTYHIAAECCRHTCLSVHPLGQQFSCLGAEQQPPAGASMTVDSTSGNAQCAVTSAPRHGLQTIHSYVKLYINKILCQQCDCLVCYRRSTQSTVAMNSKHESPEDWLWTRGLGGGLWVGV